MPKDLHCLRCATERELNQLRFENRVSLFDNDCGCVDSSSFFFTFHHSMTVKISSH